MFKKKPHVKPLAPIRSSDRRKLADQIIQVYGLTINVADDATDDDKAAATAQHTALRNSLLPDNVQTGRFTTTHGPDLKQVSGTLYVGSHSSGQDARVLWFALDGIMYPSVYSLWQNPRLVPLLHTPEAVVEKLKGGANLMTPGLAGPPFPPKATTGATVAVASHDSPSVPVAVGTCAIDIAGLTSARGAKGHAVETLHWVGDEVWSYSTSGKPGRPPPTGIDEWLPKDSGGFEADTKLSLEDDEDGGVPLTDSSKVAEDKTHIEAADAGKTEVVDALTAKPLTTKEVDDAFRNAFLFGVHEHVTSNPAHPSHGLDFPLSQSFVMSTLIQPFLPVSTAEDAKQLQIKNSSFKGLKKFIKSLDKQRLIRAKDKPNETLILDIDFRDAAITEFKPYRLPKKETAPGTAQSHGTTATTTMSDDDPSIGQELSLRTIYKVPDRLITLFDPPPSSNLVTASELKAVVASYIERHALVSPKNKRLSKLDPFLCDNLFDGPSSLDAQVRAQGTVARDALADRALAACTAHWTLSRRVPGEASPSVTKPKAGAPPRVRITLETRSGNKTATKISGMERFGVNPGLLADELRKSCAGSTSVEPLTGASPKDGLSEIMVQGPQKDAVIKALEKRGVKGAWVEVVDKVKKKK